MTVTGGNVAWGGSGWIAGCSCGGGGAVAIAAIQREEVASHAMPASWCKMSDDDARGGSSSSRILTCDRKSCFFACLDCLMPQTTHTHCTHAPRHTTQTEQRPHHHQQQQQQQQPHRHTAFAGEDCDCDTVTVAGDARCGGCFTHANQRVDTLRCTHTAHTLQLPLLLRFHPLHLPLPVRAAASQQPAHSHCHIVGVCTWAHIATMSANACPASCMKARLIASSQQQQPRRHANAACSRCCCRKDAKYSCLRQAILQHECSRRLD